MTTRRRTTNPLASLLAAAIVANATEEPGLGDGDGFDEGPEDESEDEEPSTITIMVERNNDPDMYITTDAAVVVAKGPDGEASMRLLGNETDLTVCLALLMYGIGNAYGPTVFHDSIINATKLAGHFLAAEEQGLGGPFAN
jgi:hypothetical protein